MPKRQQHQHQKKIYIYIYIFDVNLFVTTQENHLINLYYTLRICLESVYFTETENFLLKVL